MSQPVIDVVKLPGGMLTVLVGGAFFLLLLLVIGIRVLYAWAQRRATADTAMNSDPMHIPTSEFPPAAPIAPRTDWLLSDNTLVRTGVVKPGQIIQPGRGEASSLQSSDAPQPAHAPVQSFAALQPPTSAFAPDHQGPQSASPTTDTITRPHPRRSKRRLRIAMMGSRGIPANYSGFETCVEQLSVRLVERGHTVTVYCRSHHINWPEKAYKGVRLVKLPTIASKHLDTIVHTFLSMLHAQFRRFDIVYICGVGNAPLAFIPRLVGKPTIVNVDGADWQRDKWGGFARRYLQMAERAATRMPTTIVADSRVVERYYMDHFHKPSVFIPYGSDVPHVPAGATLAKFGLRPDGYILWVGRLVPENNAHHVIEAYKRIGGLNTGLHLCLIGDAPYASDYIENLKATAGPGVVFTGYVFGEGYHELGSNAHIFAFASGVGGTHPALLEAMAFGNCVIVNDMAANMETVGDAAIPYRGELGADDLAEKLGRVIADSSIVDEYRQRAAHRAATVYSWEAVTDQYEELFDTM